MNTPCDPCALVGTARLLLDDGGHDHEFLRRLDRQIGRAARPDLVQHVLLRRLHRVHELLAGHAALELVGVGQERALAGDLGEVAGQDLVLLQAFDDLLGGEPLRNGHGVEDGLALGQHVHGIVNAGTRLEQELARLQVAPLAARQGVDLEEQGLLDHALALQDRGDVAGARIARDRDHLVGLERPSLLDLPLEQHDAEQRRAREGDQEGQEAAEGRQETAPGAAGGTGRHGRRRNRLDGLARGARRIARLVVAGGGGRRRWRLLSAEHRALQGWSPFGLIHG
jgi:hypothetical protein